MRSSRGIVGQRSCEPLEPRRLLAVVELAKVDGLARDIALTDANAYYAVDPTRDGQESYTSVDRVALNGKTKPQVIRPEKGKSWLLDGQVKIAAGRDRAWITPQAGGSFWSVGDGQDRATWLFDGTGVAQQTVSADRARLYFERRMSTGHYEAWVSDGTKTGTRALSSVFSQYESTIVRTAAGVVWMTNDGAGHRRMFAIDDGAPTTAREVTSLFATLTNYPGPAIRPLDAERTLVGFGQHVYIVDRAFEHARSLDLGVLGGPATASFSIIDVAPVEGGIGLLVGRSSGEVWVADAKGTHLRRVGTYGLASDGPIYDATLLSESSGFSIYTATGSTLTGGVTFGSLTGDPVPAHVPVTGPGVYRVTFADGMTRLLDGVGVDRTFRLADGSVFGVNDELAAVGELVDLTDPGHVRTLMGGFGAASNGSSIAFVSGLDSPYLYAVDPHARGGLVHGAVPVMRHPDGQYAYHVSPDDFRIDRPIVYDDVDGDGRRDDGEPWVRTEKEGDYVLLGVPAGRSTVRVAFDDDAIEATDATAKAIDLDDGAAAERGFDLSWRPAKLEVRAFDDADGDGRQDDGEAGLAGLSVFEDADGDRMVDYGAGAPRRATRADGRASYANILPAAYRIALRDTADYFYGPGGRQTAIVRPGHTTQLTFPLTHDPATATLKVRPFRDRDGDGRRRAGEPHFAAGQRVALLDANGDAIKSAMTDDGGTATFKHLYRGAYRFQIESAERELDGGTFLQAGDDAAFALAAGRRATYETPVKVATTITGTAFRDGNANGVRDAGEPVLSNVYVQLAEYARGSDATPLDAPSHAGAYTDAQGRFSLRTPLDYADEETLIWAAPGPAAYAIGSLRVANDQSHDLDVLVPVVPSVGAASLTVRTFLDADRSGTRNTDERVGSPKDDADFLFVELFRPNKGNVASESVGANGIVFSDLRPAFYRLQAVVLGYDYVITNLDAQGMTSFTAVAGGGIEIWIGYRRR